MITGGCTGYTTNEGQQFRIDQLRCKAVYCSIAPNKTKPAPNLQCVESKCPNLYLDLRKNGGKQ